MTKRTTREVVIAHAAAILARHPDLDPVEAATKALKQRFDLVEGDGIYGASKAALAMGYDECEADDNIMPRIASDVADQISSIADRVSSGP